MLSILRLRLEQGRVKCRLCRDRFRGHRRWSVHQTTAACCMPYDRRHIPIVLQSCSAKVLIVAVGERERLWHSGAISVVHGSLSCARKPLSAVQQDGHERGRAFSDGLCESTMAISWVGVYRAGVVIMKDSSASNAAIASDDADPQTLYTSTTPKGRGSVQTAQH